MLKETLNNSWLTPYDQKSATNSLKRTCKQGISYYPNLCFVARSLFETARTDLPLNFYLTAYTCYDCVLI